MVVGIRTCFSVFKKDYFVILLEMMFYTLYLLLITFYPNLS